MLGKNMGPMGPRGLGPKLKKNYFRLCRITFFCFQDFGRPTNKNVIC